MSTYTITETVDAAKAEELHDELAEKVTAHLRVLSPDATEADLILQYTKAAVAACENYTGRDILPRTWEISLAWGGNYFAFSRGPSRSYSVVDVNDDPLDMSGYTVRNDGSKRGFGLTIARGGRRFGPYCTRLGCCEFDPGGADSTVTIESGFLSLDAMPADMVQFVLLAAAGLYEHREIAADRPAQHQEWMPMYLLDSWRVIGMA